MLPPRTIAEVLVDAGVVDARAWEKAAKGAADLAAVLDRLAAARPPWWTPTGDAPPPGLSDYQQAAVLAAAETDDPDQLRAAVRLNRFLLLDALGAGGQGRLYKAWQPNPGRYVAIKLILRDGDIDRRRFEQEAQVLMAIVHPAVARFLAYERIRAADETLTDQYLMAMEFVDGMDLEPLVRRGGPVAPAVVARWGVELLQGLNELHKAGFVHRDVKPQNVRVVGVRPGGDLTGAGVKLLDFGLVKPLNAPAPDARTAAYTFVGSSEYAPPEQWPGGTLAPGSDFYALGGALYFALVGRSPFARDKHDPMAYFRAHTNDPVPDFPPHLKVPPDLARVVKRMLAKDVDDRGGATKLLSELRGAGGGAKAPAPPKPPPAPKAPAAPAPARPAPKRDADDERSPIDRLFDPLLTALERVFIRGSAGGSGLSTGERAVALLLRPVVLVILGIFILLGIRCVW